MLLNETTIDIFSSRSILYRSRSGRGNHWKSIYYVIDTIAIVTIHIPSSVDLAAVAAVPVVHAAVLAAPAVVAPVHAVAHDRVAAAPVAPPRGNREAAHDLAAEVAAEVRRRPEVDRAEVMTKGAPRPERRRRRRFSAAIRIVIEVQAWIVKT